MNVQLPTSLTASTATTSISPADRQDAKLKKACTDFESLLVYQMLSKMRSNVEKSTLFGSGEQEETFQGMLDQEYANNIAKTGSMKIADMLYSQMTTKIQNDTKVLPEKIDK